MSEPSGQDETPEALHARIAELEFLLSEAAVDKGHLRSLLDDERAEVRRLRESESLEHVQLHVQLARIRALHRQYRDVYATDETGDSCAHCNTFTDAWRVPWPCPTIQALDDPVFPAPDKETEPGYRPVLLDISRDETRHPRGADGRFVPKALEGEP